MPEENGQPWNKDYNYLRGNGVFWAGLQLPDGATLTNITVYCSDSKNDGYVYVGLWGGNLTSGEYLGSLGMMAKVETTMAGTPGEIVLHSETIDDAKIDNKNCVYDLCAAFTYDNIFLTLRGILIEYEYLP